MKLSSGDPQPIFSNVALGPSALGQHWKILASAHHLIKPHYCLHKQMSEAFSPPFPGEGGIMDSKSLDGIIDLSHFEIKNGIIEACSTADIINASLLVVY